LPAPGIGGGMSVGVGSGAGALDGTGGKWWSTGSSGLAGAGDATGADGPGCGSVAIASEAAGRGGGYWPAAGPGCRWISPLTGIGRAPRSESAIGSTGAIAGAFGAAGADARGGDSTRTQNALATIAPATNATALWDRAVGMGADLCGGTGISMMTASV
jgi:hypothetical protein